jgi:hypothetical protein
LTDPMAGSLCRLLPMRTCTCYKSAIAYVILRRRSRLFVMDTSNIKRLDTAVVMYFIDASISLGMMP